jgi:hypothetical protein
MVTAYKKLYILTSILMCLALSTEGCISIKKETIETKPKSQACIEEKEITTKTVKLEKQADLGIEPQKETVEEAQKEEKPTVRLALKFVPGDTTTYKVLTETQRSVRWEGQSPEKPEVFKGGHTGNKIEMTFTQTIQSVNDQANAVAEITIKQLKYSSIIRDNPILEFDSTKDKDPNNPLNKLIGQSYTIRITPSGRVLKVVDATQALAAIRGSTATNKIAMNLLSEKVITEQHSIPSLPPVDKNKLSLSDTWSDIKSHSFDLMGSKSYEKVYNLKKIKKTDDKETAIVQLNAIPSSEMAAELHKEQSTGLFSKMFDTTETYTGSLQLDLTNGKVKEADEKLQIEWIAAEVPTGQNQENKELIILRMSAVRNWQIEKID